MQPSGFFWNISYAAGAASSGTRWVRRSRTPSGSVVSNQRQQVADPALDVGLAHPQRQPLVEQLHHREGVRRSPVDADDRDGAAASDDVERGLQRGEPVDAHLLGTAAASPSGRIPATC